MGSYLMTRDWVLGDNITGEKLFHYRPPLVGVLLVPLTAIFGDLAGSKILAILVSVGWGIPVYLLARHWISTPAAAAVALAAVVHPFYGALTIGGYLALLGLAIAVLCWHFQLKVQEGDRRYVLPLVLSVGALVGTNQTAVPIFGVISLAFLAFGPRHKISTFISLAAAGAVALAWLPFYALHAATGAFRFPNQPFIGPQIGLGFFEGINVVAGIPGVLDHLVVAAVIIVILPLSRTRYLIAPLLVAVALGSASSSDIVVNNVLHRIAYVVPVFALILVAIALSALWQYRPRLLSAAVVAVLVLSAVLWHHNFNRVGTELTTLTPDSQAAIAWLAANTDPDSSAYVHPMGLGIWVGGLAPRMWYGSWAFAPPAALQEMDAAFGCALGFTTGCDPLDLKHIHGVEWLVVDEGSFQAINSIPETGWTLTHAASWLSEEFRAGSVRIYRLKS
jgi:hypothetical protein